MKLIHFLLPTLLIQFACSKKDYYSRVSSEGIHNEVFYNELQLYPDGTIEEYMYIDDPSDTTTFQGEVYVGEYEYRGDTLYISSQVWDFNPKDSSYFKNARNEYQKFIVKGNTLIQQSWNADNSSKDWSTFEKGKSKLFRQIEKRDSIYWIGHSSEVIPNATWHNYPGLDQENNFRDSINQSTKPN